MATPDHVREPCPDRILDDLGGAFSMGAVGGSVYHFIVGLKNSPRGERLHGGVQSVTLNAPRVGGSFAVWGGLFSAFDCGMVYLRQKEDPWNSIAAGAATGGFLQMRQGMGSATRSAIFGGILLALIEGAGILMNKMLAPPPPPKLEEQFPPMGMGFPGKGVPLPAGTVYTAGRPGTNQMNPNQQQGGSTMGEFSKDSTSEPASLTVSLWEPLHCVIVALTCGATTCGSHRCCGSRCSCNLWEPSQLWEPSSLLWESSHCHNRINGGWSLE